MKHPLLLACLLMTASLAACSNDTGIVDGSSGQYVSFNHDELVVHAPGKPDAHIAANGDLHIGNTPVAVTPAQRDLLTHYYGEAMAVRDDGVSTGKAGAALGLHAVGSVFGNLLSGTPDKIDHDMDARGKTVEAAAQHLCGDLVQLKATQETVAAQLPAFRPYQVFRGEVHCDPPPITPTPPISPTPPTPPNEHSQE